MDLNKTIYLLDAEAMDSGATVVRVQKYRVTEPTVRDLRHLLVPFEGTREESRVSTVIPAELAKPAVVIEGEITDLVGETAPPAEPLKNPDSDDIVQMPSL